ncbi:MAG TPA: response regulator [Povalibacter sp.]|uniref:response regulator transcription factor n=1 Tax=Povalibacter sp. TaxID=1962978 RepID=UPI002CF807AE|nr:response regulator [Povalibacter sp.]HMN45492.1 response regulator [Povalibacter sp.]
MRVYVVDDDAALCEALGRLLRSAGFDPRLLSSAQEFLAQELPEAPTCLVLDVQLPDLNGLDLQAELAAAHIQIPIVFISGRSDIPVSVRAMKAGALEFLTKPLHEEEFLDAVRTALERDGQRLQERQAASIWRSRYESLTSRERQVMELVVRGMLNKQIAAAIGIAEKTVKVHRGQVTRKMGVRSVAELVRITQQLLPVGPASAGLSLSG